jgi:hypothetical protein
MLKLRGLLLPQTLPLTLPQTLPKTLPQTLPLQQSARKWSWAL